MGKDTTRERILSLIASAGPITAAALAEKLSLTSAAVRRHLGALIDDGLIADHELPHLADRGRGRPARSFVATSEGQRALQSAYSEVAREAVNYLRDRGDLTDFVEAHAARLEASLAGVVDHQAPIADRVEALSSALADLGYATSVRPGPGGHTIQLCQGHCPVQEIAQVAPEWCEAEARAFSSVLNVHVQRLSTLAQGAHVCTTTIPLTPALKEG
ncbi:winged helix-turn-helix transcriptional regulator [Demequina sp. TTPB684]|uniref:helix-turn-helix transcriptional regulator n=1 Tax=unclassified Demequina TaxID=2620311 RepID=UPI001CF243DB|nr:winged helix-turn-helix transcriptional regulator [Demequina sp. TMPB413]MCB2413880.1 winged helix-turn-helix transcriptional regulator [Demequina sp. TTPB684]UPU89432.1 winged helix-turn-helix transcriptional regulator [Demequina sp. TMPB413]